MSITHSIPTPYRISTITATGSINTEINLKNLFDIIDVIDKNDNTTGIVYLEYGKTKFESISKGTNVKKIVKSRKIKQIKRFDNQATAVIKIISDRLYYINMKIFKNGNIQMTGIKNIEDGSKCINYIIDIIKNYTLNNNINSPDYLPIVTSIDTLIQSNFKVQLINSDFKIDLKIKRDILYRLLIDEYNILCSYEPCIYPGVKIQYFWNENINGKCECQEHCSTKKKKAICKKITIAVFQSGCIIITGANQINQVDDTYKFICNIINKHYEDIYKVPLIDFLEAIPKESNVIEYIYIKKKSIVNPELLTR
jgi:TATA-box binding protein (TBP) (component of TFIID and TFIIIB)